MLWDVSSDSVIQQSKCLPNISDYVGFLPRAENSRAVIVKEMETTVPSEETMEVPKTHSRGQSKQEASEAVVGHLCSLQDMPDAGGIYALGAGAISTSSGSRCQ